MITSEAEYFELFRGDSNPMPDIPALLQEYEAIKARGFPRVNEKYVDGRWVVTIHEALGTANPWEGSAAKSTRLQDAIVDAMIPYAENRQRYLDWVATL